MSLRLLWKSRWAFLFLLLALGALVGAGCATTDNENASERPWNTPKGWETGFPAGLYDRQR